MPESRGARRGARRSSRPTLSVILLSRGEGSRLAVAAGTLQKQCAAADAELLIVRAGSQADIAATTRAFPGARIIAASADATEPELRVLGLAEASGDIVAFTNDHAVVPEHWIDGFQRALGRAAEEPPTERGETDAIVGE